MHLHHLWALAMKLLSSYGLNPSAASTATSRKATHQPTMTSYLPASAAALHTLRRAADYASDTLYRSAALAATAAVPPAVGATSAGGTAAVHRMLKLGCPHG